jgi:hypothetical protein
MNINGNAKNNIINGGLMRRIDVWINMKCISKMKLRNSGFWNIIP